MLELLAKADYIEGFPPTAEHGVPAAPPEKLKKGILDMILEKGSRARPYLPQGSQHSVVVDGIEVQFMLVNVAESGVDVIDHDADEAATTLFDVTFQVAVLKVELGQARVICVCRPALGWRPAVARLDRGATTIAALPIASTARVFHWRRAGRRPAPCGRPL